VADRTFERHPRRAAAIFEAGHGFQRREERPPMPPWMGHEPGLHLLPSSG